MCNTSSETTSSRPSRSCFHIYALQISFNSQPKVVFQVTKCWKVLKQMRRTLRDSKILQVSSELNETSQHTTHSLATQNMQQSARTKNIRGKTSFHGVSHDFVFRGAKWSDEWRVLRMNSTDHQHLQRCFLRQHVRWQWWRLFSKRSVRQLAFPRL